MYTFKNDEIVILLGAGASVDANIPHSAEMIGKIENLIKDNDKWKDYKELYDYIRSSIYYSYGIQGKFGSDVNYNVETLVNTLDELTKKQEHTLYPFVGSWNPTLIDLAGNNFDLIKNLKAEILRELRGKWLELSNKEVASYYKGLVKFKAEYEFPLRVFSLNYDLCLETACEQKDVDLEVGFNKERKWDWRLFTEVNPDETPDMYLYKLHGSTNWYYDNDDRLTYSDSPNTIEDNNAAIIFGTSYKLQYKDPFLFLAYEFRKWVLDCKIIVCIGYGFGDDHINKIIQQALNHNEQRLLLSVSPFSIEGDIEACRNAKRDQIAASLQHKRTNQIFCCEDNAKKFMEETLTLDFLGRLFPPEDELFPVLN